MKAHILSLLIASSLWAGAPQEAYKELLQYAACNGQVDYEKLGTTDHIAKAEEEFQSVTELTLKSSSEHEQIAWYSNLYNFYTIKLIVEKQPKKSIQDIGSPWDKKCIPLFGTVVSLNHIEHQILRKDYAEPRIHFALVCASIGCPPLRGTPFTGKNLAKEMDEQAKIFLTDKSKNRVEGTTLYLSKIFQWYGDDFTGKYGSYQNYVKNVLGVEGRVKVKFTDYDWNLNKTVCK